MTSVISPAVMLDNAPLKARVIGRKQSRHLMDAGRH